MHANEGNRTYFLKTFTSEEIFCVNVVRKIATTKQRWKFRKNCIDTIVSFGEKIFF